MKLTRLLVAVAALVLLSACAQPPARGPVVLAASSLAEALEDVASAWEREGHARPVLSFAGTPALARQVAGGAPADVIITADSQWLDWLDERELLVSASRRNLLSNTLVLVGAPGTRAPLWLPPGSMADVVGTARIATADTEAVPAGRYARAGLEALGEWEALRAQLVPTENVRAALALVEQGETEFGIVYGSDHAVSGRVALLGSFPPGSHPRIIYPAALVAGTSQHEASAFLEYLSSPTATEIFRRHGFGSL